MLIRSQNKAVLLSFGNLAAIYTVKDGDDFIISSLEGENKCTLGKYSTEAKAMKVLDMIQKRYSDYQTTHTVSNGLATISLFVDCSDEINELYMKVQNALGKTVVFQMPEDSEVEV